MSEVNNGKSGVFGEIKLGENITGDNTSYFESNTQNRKTSLNFEDTTKQGNGTISFNVSNNENSENNTNGSNANGFQKASGYKAFGSFETNKKQGWTNNDPSVFQPIGQDKAITKQGLWSKIKAFLFQEVDLTAPIKVELTPYQQKVEDEINEFLHQEVSFKGIFNIFKGKNNKN